MAFVKARRRLAAWICPEVELRSSRRFVDVDEAGEHAAARKRWIEAERAAYLSRAKEPFFTPEESRASFAASRESRIKCAKEILQICQRVQLHGFVGDPDFTLDLAADRLADLLAGRPNDGGQKK